MTAAQSELTRRREAQQLRDEPVNKRIRDMEEADPSVFSRMNKLSMLIDCPEFTHDIGQYNYFVTNWNGGARTGYNLHHAYGWLTLIDVYIGLVLDGVPLAGLILTDGTLSEDQRARFTELKNDVLSLQATIRNTLETTG